MTDKIVLALSGQGANDALRGLMAEYANALTELGLTVVHVSLSEGEIDYAVNQIAGGRVDFALTLQGLGQGISIATGTANTATNVWDAFRIPLIKLHGDSPAYFIDRHSDVPTTSANLYHASEFIHFRRRWLPNARTLTASVPPLTMSPLPRSAINASVRRSGKFVFLKNGNSPQTLRQRWFDQLPSSLARLVDEMANTITPHGLRPGVLHIADFVAEFLTSKGIELAPRSSLLFFFTAQLDDYLRRVKSEMIADAILDLPVIIQGSLWEHIDFVGRRAQLAQGQDFDATQRIYSEQLGIIDMSANVDTWPHDRVQRAAGSFAPVLTNRQGWLERDFPGFDAFTFEFDPESIKSRVSEAIANPERYLELGVAFGERFREVYPRDAFANRVIDMAELVALYVNPQKPSIQPFFVWPSG
jgi:hypothetical protein